MPRQIRLLILDLDYIVLDCAALKARALRQSLIAFSDLLSHDVRLPDSVDIEEAFRDRGSRWVQSLQIGMDEEQLLALEKDCLVHEIRFLNAGVGKAYPGISEFLSACRSDDLQLALGAEGTRDYVMAVCDKHEMDQVFDIALSTEEFGMGGPDEMLAELMTHCEVNPSETLLLATRPRFFESGRDLGVLSIGCGWGIQEHAALADADFQSLSLQHAYPIIRQADAVLSGESV